MLVKVVAVQAEIGCRLSLEEKIFIFKQKPDFVCLPEYYLLDGSIGDHHRAALRQGEYLEYLQNLSDELSTCLIAGTVVEAEKDRLYNSCYVVNRGLVIGRYRKRFPVAQEREQGIGCGNEHLILNVEGVRIAVLICADVFFDHLFDELAAEQVDLIFLPTTSVYRPADSISMKEHRDRIYFQAAAGRSRALVVKVCGVGRLFGKPLQGRSLVAAPWGILHRIDFSAERNKRMLSMTLDIDEVRDFRKKFHSCSEPEAADSVFST